MNRRKNYNSIQAVLAQPAEIYADLHGSNSYPSLRGYVGFYPLWGGTLLAAEVTGLLAVQDASCENPFCGFHIHEGGSCEKGTKPDEPFPMAGTHYNPFGCGHPAHAGDLPPLLSCNGFAFQIFYTDKFTPEEVLGKTVIIHNASDDFTTQPSGNSGTMSACGEIKSIWQAK